MLRPGRRRSPSCCHRAVASYVVNSGCSRHRGRAGARCGTTAFRQVHDLSVLTQNTERRGALVSRVTSDVDTISQFVQFGGLHADPVRRPARRGDVLMAFYSWPLTLLVLACFVPLLLVLAPVAEVRLAPPTRAVRERVGDMLGGHLRDGRRRRHDPRLRVEERTGEPDRRGDRAAPRAPPSRRQVRSCRSASPPACWSPGSSSRPSSWRRHLARACDGDLTLGELLAFLFLVQLFTGPVQSVTEILNELQNAVAGWRRVHRRARHPGRRGRPGRRRRRRCRAARSRSSSTASRFAYPGGQPVLRDVDLADRPAQPRSPSSARPARARPPSPSCSPGCRTRPRAGCCSTASTCARCGSPRLRERVVMVPQEGFLFDDDAAARTSGSAGPRRQRRRRRAGADRARARATGWPGCRTACDTARRPARRVAVGGGAAARRAGPRLPRRPRPAGARRGDRRRRPRHRGPAAARARRAHPRPHRRSPSRTGCRPPRPPTRSWSSTRGAIVETRPPRRPRRAGGVYARPARLAGRPSCGDAWVCPTDGLDA